MPSSESSGGFVIGREERERIQEVNSGTACEQSARDQSAGQESSVTGKGSPAALEILL